MSRPKEKFCNFHKAAKVKNGSGKWVCKECKRKYDLHRYKTVRMAVIDTYAGHLITDIEQRYVRMKMPHTLEEPWT